MHRYEARISWSRNEAAFLDNRYSRKHEWSFDGGARVPASSSPSLVPEPMSSAAAVDPEEALVAATSSCHMLWFLALAAERGFVVESYTDAAYGVMDKNRQGRIAITRITLRPQVTFATQHRPQADALGRLHRDAHERCFIANSLTSEVVIEPP